MKDLTLWILLLTLWILLWILTLWILLRRFKGLKFGLLRITVCRAVQTSAEWVRGVNARHLIDGFGCSERDG